MPGERVKVRSLKLTDLKEARLRKCSVSRGGGGCSESEEDVLSRPTARVAVPKSGALAKQSPRTCFSDAEEMPTTKPAPVAVEGSLGFRNVFRPRSITIEG